MTVFGMITPTVAVILLIIALIIFGPGKLPQIGRGLGKGIRDFKSEVNIESDDLTDLDKSGGDSQNKQVQA